MSTELAVDNLRRYRADPVAFVREVLGGEPDEWQIDVLYAIARSPKNRVCMKASKGPGKSTVLAWAVLWFLVTHLHPKVICTSISEKNLADGLWAECAKWMNKSPLLTTLFEWTASRITCREHPETWWASARTWPKGGSADEQANTLAGVHADNMLFVLDEAGGIPQSVAVAADAGLANASKEHGRVAKMLIAGNPTHLEGPLYRACTIEKAMWEVFEVSGDPEDPKRAPRVSIDWARGEIAKWGREHPFVLINVFGRFPPGSPNTLLGPDQVADAMKRKIPLAVYKDEAKILGVDVARYGDDRTVISMRQGLVVYEPVILRNLDTMEVAARVALLMDKHKPDALFIDSATFGAGVVDRLHQLKYEPSGVDFGGKPVMEPHLYRNRRAEMWCRMAEWVKAGGRLPPLSELTAELTTPQYKFDEHNHLQLEKKEEIKKRTGVSPDIADSIALTFAAPVAPRALRDALHQSGATGAKADYSPFRRAI